MRPMLGTSRCVSVNPADMFNQLKNRYFFMRCETVFSPVSGKNLNISDEMFVAANQIFLTQCWDVSQPG